MCGEIGPRKSEGVQEMEAVIGAIFLLFLVNSLESGRGGGIETSVLSLRACNKTLPKDSYRSLVWFAGGSVQSTVPSEWNNFPEADFGTMGRIHFY
jgi:hypothetical protein